MIGSAVKKLKMAADDIVDFRKIALTSLGHKLTNFDEISKQIKIIMTWYVNENS